VIDSKFPVELNGKKYTLAEDAEGAHYQWRREPLRAPTNGFVLGDTGKFTLRPDLLQWSITDWSGGEGVHSFDLETSNGYSLGYNIDPFSVYGTLRLSQHYTAETGITFDQSVMAIGLDKVWLVALDQAGADALVYYYNFATNIFVLDGTDTSTTSDAGAREAWGDSDGLYFGGRISDIIKWSGSAFTGHTTSGWQVVGSVGGYLYSTAPASTGLQVYEQSLGATGSGTLIFTILEAKNAANLGLPLFWDGIAGQNALYIVATPTLFETVIYRVEPTTAAGPGFGHELVRVPGFRGLVPLYNLGLLYVVGFMGNIPAIFYYDEVDGSLGLVYQNTRRPIAHAQTPNRNLQEVGGGYGAEFSKNHFILMGGPSDNNGTSWTLMTLDAVSGGVAGGTVINVGTVASANVTELINWNSFGGNGLGRHSVVYFKGDIFVDISRTQDTATPAPGQSKVFRLRKNTYTDNLGIMESSVNDFGLLSEKVLTSITLITEPLPNASSITVKYQIDQDGVWLTAGTFTTNAGTEETFILSTDSITRRFRNLQLRVELDNGNVTTETPVIRAIRVFCTVVEGVNTWSLILNASDELGAMQNRAWGGATLIENITTAASNNAVVAFKDGYTNRKPGSYREYDVVIDDVTVVNDRPGEGTIQVTLREVI